MTPGLLSCTEGRLPPVPVNHVTDSIGFLSESCRKEVSKNLALCQTKTGHHVLVWIATESLGDIEPSAFSFAAFNAWQVGNRKRDDGVVLFIYPLDKKVWITLGYGLEGREDGQITDREAQSISEKMAKEFAEGKNDEGVRLGVSLILAELDKKG